MKRFLACAFLALVAVTTVRAEQPLTDRVTIHPDLVYGHKMGMALTLDLIQPKKKLNGAATLFMMSGGWVSTWTDPKKLLSSGVAKQAGFTALLEKGYTLIIVRHGSSPKFLVPEAVDDVRRAVRYVKKCAPDFSFDPDRLGVFGGSAGGHLSLMLGTTASKDTQVAAVVAYYPPTFLEPYVKDEKFRKAFPALLFDQNLISDVSPLAHVTSDDAPTLLLHGKQDKLVPPIHSDKIHAAFKKADVESELIHFDKAGHSFQGKDGKEAVAAMVGWFDEHLAKQE